MATSPRLAAQVTNGDCLARCVAAALDRRQPAAAADYPPGPGRLAEMVAAARRDQQLAARLLALPRGERLAVVERDDAFRRLSLAWLLVLNAEAALEDPTAEAEEAAELAAAIAARVPWEPGGRARRTAALAEWLLGKALLRRAAVGGRLGAAGGALDPDPCERLAAAERAFNRMFGHIASGQPARERGLACAGLAQLRWRQGRLVEAGALLARAAQELAGVHAVQPMAACHVLHGLLLVSTRELMLGRLELLKVERLLDVRLAPSLGVFAAVGLACCEAGTGGGAAAARQMARARSLSALVPEESRAVRRLWRQLAAAEGGAAAHDAGREAGAAVCGVAPAAACRAARRPDMPDAAAFAEGVPPALGDLDSAMAGFLAGLGEDGAMGSGADPAAIVTLADRLLLGRAEDEAPLGRAGEEDEEAR